MPAMDVVADGFVCLFVLFLFIVSVYTQQKRIQRQRKLAAAPACEPKR
jgi:hypothetical protein